MFQRIISQIGSEDFETPDDFSAAILEALRDALADNPDLIEELAPGMRLVERTMSSEERAAVALPKANQVRLDRAARRKAQAFLEIQNARQANPAITLVGIAAWLDRAGIKPQRRERWDARAVKRILKEHGIDHNDQPGSA